MLLFRFPFFPHSVLIPVQNDRGWQGVIVRETLSVIRGVIRSSVFLGLTTHYFITTGSGQELEILQTQEGQDILPDGSAVTLTVKAGRINVFRRATEETLIREEGL